MIYTLYFTWIQDPHGQLEQSVRQCQTIPDNTPQVSLPDFIPLSICLTVVEFKDSKTYIKLTKLMRIHSKMKNESHYTSRSPGTAHNYFYFPSCTSPLVSDSPLICFRVEMKNPLFIPNKYQNEQIA